MDEGQLVEQVLISLRKIVRSIDLHSHRLIKTCGLTGPQLVLMKEIERCGTCCPSDLAKTAKLSNATVTGIVRRLESRGFVNRCRSEHDRRRHLVSLTPDGRNALDTAPAMLQDKLAGALVDMKEWEQSLLLSSLQRLAEVMDAETIEAAPILSSGALTRTESQTLEALSELSSTKKSSAPPK